jgi:hypothetical protein
MCYQQLQKQVIDPDEGCVALIRANFLISAG